MMSPQLKSLIWLEWQQRRWQMAICLMAFLVGLTVMLTPEVRKGLRFTDHELQLVLFIPAMMLPIFFAMNTSHGEIVERTLSFSEALPVVAADRAKIRLWGGIAALVVSLTVAMCVLSLVLIGGGHLVNTAYLELPFLSAMRVIWFQTLVFGCASSTLYIVIATLGSRLPNQTATGAVGVVVLVLTMILMNVWYVSDNPWSVAAHFFARTVSPLTLLTQPNHPPGVGYPQGVARIWSVKSGLAVNLVFQVAMSCLFVRHCSRRHMHSVGANAKRSAKPVRWRIPMRLRLPTSNFALVWITLRQILPICLAGLVIAALLALVSILQRDIWSIEQFLETMAETNLVVGVLWSVVVGTMIFHQELDSRVGEFWRATPISVGRLFAVKFIAGLATVILVLDMTAMGCIWVLMPQNSLRSPSEMVGIYSALFLPVHAMMYVVAVATACLLRRPILGGMMAVATVAYGGLVMSSFKSLNYYSPIGILSRLYSDYNLKLSDSGFPVMILGMAVIGAAATTVAYRALRRYAPYRLLSGSTEITNNDNLSGWWRAGRRQLFHWMDRRKTRSPGS